MSCNVDNTPKNKLTKKKRDKIFIIGMLFLPLLHFLIFYIYVNFDSILLAFQIPLNGGKVKWGFDNFKRMFQEFSISSSVLTLAFSNTMAFFFVGLFVTFPLSFLLCYFLYKKIAGYKVYRVIFFLPSIISASVIAILFKYMLAGNGPIAEIYKYFGETIPRFLSSNKYALNTLIFYTVFFGIGGNLVLFSGAMSNIDNSIVEAGKVDGANMVVEITHIIIPLMWPTLSTVLIFNFVGIFGASGPILLLTKGQFNTYTISYWIYDLVTFHSQLNYPATVGLFFSIIGMPIALFMRWLLNHGVDNVSL